MDVLNYTGEHEAFRQRLRNFLSREVLPNVEQWESDHSVPREAWRAMGREGFLCTAVDPRYGGLGGDFLFSVIGIEEMARTNQGGFMTLLHSDIVVPYIERYGTTAQKEKYLPGCVSGDCITAVAMTEPGAGSDLAAMSATAVADGNRIVLNGTKTFISNGIHCGLVIVAARDPAVERAHQAISLYLVEDGTPGFTRPRPRPCPNPRRSGSPWPRWSRRRKCVAASSTSSSRTIWRRRAWWRKPPWPNTRPRTWSIGW